jgi:CDGSH-type Zn-finger protein
MVAMANITPLPNGPLMVDGKLTDGEGTVVKEGKFALCRCGHSANKPFCDGGHTAAGFQAE